MNLGVLLSIGDSLENQSQTGQLDRFEKFYLEKYDKFFNKVFVFSYGDKNFSQNHNFILIPKKISLHRYFYTFLIPFLNKNFRKISIFRVMQTTGAVPAILAKIFYKIPFVVTYGYKYHQFAKIEGKFLIAILIKILEVLTLKAANGIIVTTQELVDYVEEFAKKENIYLIPNGVETKLFEPKIKKFDNKNIQIISIGRLETQKNYANLIKAIAYSKHRPYIILTLVGKGSLKKQLQEMAKKLKVKLKIVDFVSHISLPKFFQRADIFVLPSLIEGHPKVLLEALSCGLPSVISRVPGSIEIITNNKTGLFCETKASDIVKKIDKLIGNGQLRKKIGEAGRDYILKHHEIERLVSKEISVLKKFADD